jgi:hypothetical protein
MFGSSRAHAHLFEELGHPIFKFTPRYIAMNPEWFGDNVLDPHPRA